MDRPRTQEGCWKGQLQPGSATVKPGEDLLSNRVGDVPRRDPKSLAHGPVEEVEDAQGKSAGHFFLGSRRSQTAPSGGSRRSMSMTASKESSHEGNLDDSDAEEGEVSAPHARNFASRGTHEKLARKPL